MNEKTIGIVNEILEEFIALKNDTIDTTIQLNKEIIEKYQVIKQETLAKNKATSFATNIFRTLNILETQHSKFLAFLLDPEEMHGQGSLFLDKFLERLPIKRYPNEKWIIETESENVDIFLSRDYPEIGRIIIENKARYAGDQENQIFRYWFKKIFIPFHSETKTQKALLKDKKRFILIYLHPNKSIPSLNSLEIPLDEEYTKHNLESLESKHILPMDFKSDIRDWLEECLKEISDSNLKLKDILNQYINLWKQ